MKDRRRLALATALAALALIAAHRIRRARNDPSALPYGRRRWTELPRPFVTRARLRGMLALGGDERVLEVGPGTGYYALHVAGWLSAGGTLDVLDVQQEMLDHTMAGAREAGTENVIPTRGDARCLPYPDDAFDAAYLVATLGGSPIGVARSRSSGAY